MKEKLVKEKLIKEKHFRFLVFFFQLKSLSGNSQEEIHPVLGLAPPCWFCRSGYSLPTLTGFCFSCPVCIFLITAK